MTGDYDVVHITTLETFETAREALEYIENMLPDEREGIVVRGPFGWTTRKEAADGG